MKSIKRNFLALMLAMGSAGMVMAADYGLPAAIQDGNILHCFNWTMADVKAELPNIAAAGFGSVQLSPLQRADVRQGSPWHDLYRPYDLAFKSSGMGSEQDLKSLCEEAASYGIKIIVDVVANHVDKTSGYHDTWWDSNGRVRWNGGINYGDRYSITHGQLGDYGDINSEDAEVCARGKAYVQKLHDLGVKGIRWDAAKHIGLPSEGCNFWSSVTSVAGMYHYGEILDAPGPNASIIKEYTNYMSVTDNKYSNGAARENGGIPFGYGGAHVVDYGCSDTKMVYWAESHDTYANDEWSQNVDQSVIDRAYASFACRNGATALYLSRPNAKGFNNIKVGKGSTAFKSKAITEVNRFRNAMVGKADWCEAGGNTFCVTRKDGGAVIVMKGSGNVSVKNGGGYCPAGTYTDKVSGATFTVTASTISGNVGSSGIAVIYNGSVNPNPDPNPDPNPNPNGGLYILGNLTTGGWSTTPGTGVQMSKSGTTYTAKNVSFTAATGETKCYFNLTDYVGATWDDLNMSANRYGAATEGAAVVVGTPATIVKYANGVDASGCLSWTLPAGSYDITADLSTMKLTVTAAGDDPNPNPNPDPNPGTLTITGDYNLAYSGSYSHVHYWGGASASTWPGVAFSTATGSDGRSYKVAKVPAGTSGLVFNNNGNGQTGDLTYSGSFVMDDNGATTTAVVFNGNNPNPNPDPNPGDFTIYYDNSNTSWSNVNIHYWATPSTTWPGTTMTKVEGNIWKYTFPSDPSSLTGFLFCDGSGSGDNNQTADHSGAPVNGHLYKGAGGAKGAVSDEGVYSVGPQKPVVTASPASGSRFSESVKVTLSVAPATTIYYTIDGSTPNASSSRYSAPLTFTETTTLKTYVKNDVGENIQSFTYTKNSGPVPQPGNSLNTDYYKVNPDGKVGSNKTINMTFTKLNNDNRMCVADNALSNWTENELIAQGVTRDIASALRGKHEYPVVDSYAIYAAYDSQNLYLGVQYVYTVWDLYGDGKQTNGAAKPYNMDGRLMIAFDLDPYKEMSGVLTSGSTIWDEGGQFNTFDNGTDCIWIGSTKSTVGTPGLFFPMNDGKTSYDAPYCVSLDAPFYGCQDGLLPSITHIWGQKDFEYDAEMLQTNDNFVDLINEIPKDQHTFYEWKFPLSKLGITEDYIKNTGIGVMVIDTYGQGATGSTPYDPTCFDNAKTPYSKDNSSSAEKEDTDCFTYAHARIGKLAQTSGVETIVVNTENVEDAAPEYYNLQGVRVLEPTPGIYVVRRGNVVTKEVVR